MTREIPLIGFEHNNLLAFLALMGLLKALDNSRPKWEPRISWVNFIPHLHISSDVKNEEIARAVIDGIKKIGELIKFEPKQTLKLKYEEFKELQKNVSPEIMISLGSDGCVQKDGVVEYPPLCLQLGSGHQYFLERLSDATNVNVKDEQVLDEISNVLFTNWEYKDKSNITFRWDPKEYRPHANMANDPSIKKFLAVNGANRLAAIGFTNYWCVPTKNGLGTIACQKSNGGTSGIFWPIWSKKLSLDAILIILRHPHIKDIQNKTTKRNLQNMGICCVISANIFWEGKFGNVTWGKRVI